jgi:Rrf2 family protein
MKISRETDYAIRCVLHLAIAPEKVHMVDEIASARHVPKSFLAKILQKLKREDIVKSYRGVKGGFRLSRAPSDITLLDVIRASQGGVDMNICAVDENACAFSSDCVIHPIWVNLKAEVETSLQQYDFKSLVEKELNKINA